MSSSYQSVYFSTPRPIPKPLVPNPPGADNDTLRRIWRQNMGIQKQNIMALDNWKEKKREHEEQRAGIRRALTDRNQPKPRVHWQKPYERANPPARREQHPPQIRRVSTLTASANSETLATTSRHNRRRGEDIFSFGQTIICDICHARGGEEARTCRERPHGSLGYSCINCYGSSHRKCRWYGEFRYEHGLSAFYEGRARPAPQLRRQTAVSQEFEEPKQGITAGSNVCANNAVDAEREKLKELALLMGQLLNSAQQLLDEIEINNSLVG